MISYICTTYEYYDIMIHIYVYTYTHAYRKLTCYNKQRLDLDPSCPWALDPWISFRPKKSKFSKSTLELQSALRPNTNVAIPTSSRNGIPPGVHTYMHHTTLMATESHDGPSPSFQNIPYPAHTIFISSKDVMPRF